MAESFKNLPLDSVQQLEWACASENLRMLKLAFAVSFTVLLLVENNVLTVGFRPMLKPIMTHLEMIHLST
jgi:hypothetical protein